MPNKQVKNRFSMFVQKYKNKYGFDSYLEAIIDIIETRLFEEVDFDNVNRFINDGLKEKLYLEANDKRLIKKNFSKKIKKLI